MLRTSANASVPIAITKLKAAPISKLLVIPIEFASGAAIAKPIGRNIIDPIASKEETLERDSRGTNRCSAVDQIVPQRSNVIPQRKAQKKPLFT